MQNFGVRVKRLRESRGVSIEQVASETKVNVLMLKDWENIRMVLSVEKFNCC